MPLVTESSASVVDVLSAVADDSWLLDPSSGEVPLLRRVTDPRGRLQIARCFSLVATRAVTIQRASLDQEQRLATVPTTADDSAYTALAFGWQPHLSRVCGTLERLASWSKNELDASSSASGSVREDDVDGRSRVHLHLDMHTAIAKAYRDMLFLAKSPANAVSAYSATLPAFVDFAASTPSRRALAAVIQTLPMVHPPSARGEDGGAEPHSSSRDLLRLFTRGLMMSVTDADANDPEWIDDERGGGGDCPGDGGGDAAGRSQPSLPWCIYDSLRRTLRHDPPTVQGLAALLVRQQMEPLGGGDALRQQEGHSAAAVQFYAAFRAAANNLSKVTSSMAEWAACAAAAPLLGIAGILIASSHDLKQRVEIASRLWAALCEEWAGGVKWTNGGVSDAAVARFKTSRPHQNLMMIPTPLQMTRLAVFVAGLAEIQSLEMELVGIDTSALSRTVSTALGWVELARRAAPSAHATTFAYSTCRLMETCLALPRFRGHVRGALFPYSAFVALLEIGLRSGQPAWRLRLHSLDVFSSLMLRGATLNMELFSPIVLDLMAACAEQFTAMCSTFELPPDELTEAEVTRMREADDRDQHVPPPKLPFPDGGVGGSVETDFTGRSPFFGLWDYPDPADVASPSSSYRELASMSVGHNGADDPTSFAELPMPETITPPHGALATANPNHYPLSVLDDVAMRVICRFVEQYSDVGRRLVHSVEHMLVSLISTWCRRYDSRGFFALTQVASPMLQAACGGRGAVKGGCVLDTDDKLVAVAELLVKVALHPWASLAAAFDAVRSVGVFLERTAFDAVHVLPGFEKEHERAAAQRELRERAHTFLSSPRLFDLLGAAARSSEPLIMEAGVRSLTRLFWLQHVYRGLLPLTRYSDPSGVAAPPPPLPVFFASRTGRLAIEERGRRITAMGQSGPGPLEGNGDGGLLPPRGGGDDDDDLLATCDADERPVLCGLLHVLQHPGRREDLWRPVPKDTWSRNAIAPFRRIFFGSGAFVSAPSSAVAAILSRTAPQLHEATCALRDALSTAQREAGDPAAGERGNLSKECYLAHPAVSASWTRFRQISTVLAGHVTRHGYATRNCVKYLAATFFWAGGDDDVSMMALVGALVAALSTALPVLSSEEPLESNRLPARLSVADLGAVFRECSAEFLRPSLIPALLAEDRDVPREEGRLDDPTPNYPVLESHTPHGSMLPRVVTAEWERGVTLSFVPVAKEQPRRVGRPRDLCLILPTVPTPTDMRIQRTYGFSDRVHHPMSSRTRAARAHDWCRAVAAVLEEDGTEPADDDASVDRRTRAAERAWLAQQLIRKFHYRDSDTTPSEAIEGIMEERAAVRHRTPEASGPGAIDGQQLRDAAHHVHVDRRLHQLRKAHALAFNDVLSTSHVGGSFDGCIASARHAAIRQRVRLERRAPTLRPVVIRPRPLRIVPAGSVMPTKDVCGIAAHQPVLWEADSLFTAS